jgi:hypothetical protein
MTEVEGLVNTAEFEAMTSGVTGTGFATADFGTIVECNRFNRRGLSSRKRDQKPLCFTAQSFPLHLYAQHFARISLHHLD